MEKILVFEEEKEDQFSYVDYLAISYQISKLLNEILD
jgi:hypothetical protein